jgi:hypothetical protein
MTGDWITPTNSKANGKPLLGLAVVLCLEPSLFVGSPKPTPSRDPPKQSACKLSNFGVRPPQRRSSCCSPAMNRHPKPGYIPGRCKRPQNTETETNSPRFKVTSPNGGPERSRPVPMPRSPKVLFSGRDCDQRLRPTACTADRYPQQAAISGSNGGAD